MPAARGVKRSASKASAATTSAAAPKNKKKRGPVTLEIPEIPTKRGRLLTCGMGDVGQLGLGEDVQEVTRFKFVSTLGDKIVAACAGGMHTVALDSDGKVWTFGCNDEGALGRTTSEEATPEKVVLPRPAAAISAGDSHTAALLDNGDVYAWGSFRDSHGSMGLVIRGREAVPSKTPINVAVGEPAAAIASGGDHLVILGVSGSIYTMGCGEQGQLGRLSQRSAGREARQGFIALLTPTKVSLRAGASRIWAGYHATFALDSAGEKMFAWGLNNYGQLGITGEKRKVALYTPTECDAFNAVADGWSRVACGQHHSIALANSGQVHAVGRCEYGRLGLGDRTGDAEALEPIPKLQDKRCVSVATGTSNSFAVTDSGEVYGWGMGSEGQLGTGGSEDAAEPTLVTGAALKNTVPLVVSAGGQHTILLTQDPTKAAAASPAPEAETAEQKAEDEDATKAEAESGAPKAKRQKKKTTEEAEVSSTSAAAEPQKVNGKDKKETAMEVDETDNTQEDDKKPEPSATDDSTTLPAETTTENKPDTTPQPDPEPKNEEQKTSQETPEKKTEEAKTNVDANNTDANTEAKTNDVEMKEVEPVNGAPEENVVAKEPVEKKSEAMSTEPAVATA